MFCRQPPPIISGTERVSSLRVGLLVVVIRPDLGISAHLDQVISSCASSMHALRQWCTTFFGRGPLLDFLIASGAKQV